LPGEQCLNFSLYYCRLYNTQRYSLCV